MLLKINKIFVSYAHDDKEDYRKLISLLNERPDFNYENYTINADEVTGDAYTADYITSKLREKIRECDTVCILIGKNTHSRKWIDFEIEQAFRSSKRIIGIFLNRAEDNNIPKKLEMYGDALVHWDLNGIINAIRGNNIWKKNRETKIELFETKIDLYRSKKILLTQVKIEKLFNKFNYDLSFNNRGINIIYGTNGSGKTTILEIINALSFQRIENLIDIPFLKITCYFSNNYMLSIRHNKKKQNQLVVKLITNKEIEINSILKLEIKNTNFLIEKGWKQITEEEWINPSQDTLYTTKNALLSVGKGLKYELKYELKNKSNPDLEELLYSFTTHFLRDVRHFNTLLNTGTSIEENIGSSKLNNTKILIKYFIHMETILKKLYIDYYKYSTNLDFDTFNEILKISENDDYIVNKDSISKQIDHLYDKFTQITKLGLFEDEESSVFEDINEIKQIKENLITIDAINLKLLWVSLEKIDQKMKVFDQILQKGLLFQELINTYFSDKKIKFNFQKGFVFTKNDGTILPPLFIESEDQPLRLFKEKLPLYLNSTSKNTYIKIEESPMYLSSGELHLFIIFYEIIFNTYKNSLILIDEPELSFHISWQQKFTKDLLRIKESISPDINFILATHSPGIVNSQWELTIRLSSKELD